MKLPMTKTEVAKIRFHLEDLEREIAPAISSALKRHFNRLTDKDGFESFGLHIMPDGRLHLDLGPLFGFDERSETTPSISFSIVDLLRDHLEAECWFAEAGKKKELLHVKPFRAQLQECLRLIDYVVEQMKEIEE
jgi:hypothetical protein